MNFTAKKNLWAMFVFGSLLLIFLNFSLVSAELSPVSSFNYQTILMARITELKKQILSLQKQIDSLLIARRNTRQTKTPGTIQKGDVGNLATSGTQINPNTATTTNLFDTVSVSDSEIAISPTGVKTSEEYQIAFMDKISKVSFTSDEFIAMKKQDKRPLVLEELINNVIQGKNDQQIKTSVLAWKNLDEKSVEALKKIQISKEILPLHRSVLTWYKYHAIFAQKISEGNLPKAEVAVLFDQYAKNAAKYSPGATQFAGAKKASISDKSFFDFFSPAIAYATGLFYDFGGQVLVGPELICTSGMTFTLRTLPLQVPVTLWIYSPVFVANPYLYKNIISGTYVIGKAVWGPGVCSYTGVLDPPTLHGIAMVIYWGSSPL